MDTLVIGMSEPADPAWVEARSLAEVERHAREGHVVLVTPSALLPVPHASGEPGTAQPGTEDAEAAEIATASVCAWLGARVFRTARPDRMRMAVHMTQVIAGDRPPTLTRRGLA